MMNDVTTNYSVAFQAPLPYLQSQDWLYLMRLFCQRDLRGKDQAGEYQHARHR